MTLTSDCTTTAFSTGVLRCTYWDFRLEVGQLYWSSFWNSLAWLVNTIFFILPLYYTRAFFDKECTWKSQMGGLSLL